MTSRTIRARAPAKINLWLRVLGRRADGYHELQTIFQSIALHDTLSVRVRPGPFALRCADPGCPTDDSNLVWQAAARMWTAAGRRGTPRDVEVTLIKRIPVEAGLGGGSSDAAAALRLFAALWRVRGMGRDRLSEVAASLGADVPYFLEGGTALGLGTGDVLFPLLDYPASWVTLALPKFGVRTADAYRWWDREHRGPAGSRTPRAGNDLQPAVVARHPEIGRLVRALERAGAFHAAMSGSGAAVFGLFATRGAALAAAVALSQGAFTARPAHRADAAGAVAGSGARPGVALTRVVSRASYQRLAGIRRHRIDLPFAPRHSGHS
jgi:4-diphosphocytidyl-2-C-methyl-D-erythritol kinase